MKIVSNKNGWWYLGGQFVKCHEAQTDCPILSSPIMHFDQRLTDAQHMEVARYMAEKYEIPLNTLIETQCPLYVEDSSGNGLYLLKGKEHSFGY